MISKERDLLNDATELLVREYEGRVPAGQVRASVSGANTQVSKERHRRGLESAPTTEYVERVLAVARRSLATIIVS